MIKAIAGAPAMAFDLSGYAAKSLIPLFFCQQGEPLGFHPRPHQGTEYPGPAPGEITPLEETNSLRLPRWGYEKYEGFWPKKARKIPRRKRGFTLIRNIYP